MRKCELCGADTPDNLSACQRCGFEFPLEIRSDIRNIELLKKHAVPMYTDNKLIWVTLENMRRTTSLTVQETEGTNLVFNFNFNGVWGGFKIFDESIHRT